MAFNPNHKYVIKRNGEKENLLFDKITQRLQGLCEGLDELLDPPVITQQLADRLVTGMTTFAIDEEAALMCVERTEEHPDWGVLAARLTATNIQKSSPKTFAEAIERLYRNTHDGKPYPLINDRVYLLVQKHKAEIESRIRHERDLTIPYFGLCTLYQSYLLRTADGVNGGPPKQVQETPQYLYMRVALGIHKDDLKAAFETYDLLSQKFYTNATPTLCNVGTHKETCSSCVLLGFKGDSLEGITDTWTDLAFISKAAAGVGVHCHNIRSKDSYIAGTNGYSNGIVPMLKVVERIAKYVDQGGNKRPGSFAVYLETWHADIEDFVCMKRNKTDDEKAARDLFYGLWICDLFMKRVEANADWTVMCPRKCPGLADCYGDEFEELYERYEREGRGVRTIKAQKLWHSILDSQIETGVPYMLYKDACNKKSNHQHLGCIKSSNLCYGGEMRVLTRTGWMTLQELCEREVDIWNGREWSRVTVKRTGKQPLLEMKINGLYVAASWDHGFLLKDGTEVRACELRKGMELCDYTLPDFANGCEVVGYDPYTAGIAAFGGQLCHYNEHTRWAIDGFATADIKGQRMGERWYLDLPTDEECVPVNASWADKVEFVRGLASFQADYDVFIIRKDCIAATTMLMQSLGIKAYGYNDQLVVCNANRLWTLLGNHLDIPDREFKVIVESISEPTKPQETYCFEEPLQNCGLVNGVLAKNCCEVVEFTAEDEIAVCNLSSLALPMYVKYRDGKPYFDFQHLFEVTKVVTRNLDKIIDLNAYPEHVPETKTSNFRHRPIGIGVQGLADVYILMRYPFESEEAAALNKLIFETIYYAALTASCELAQKLGVYPSYKDYMVKGQLKSSPVSQGILQYDMWGVVPSDLWDWGLLKENIAKHGVRNSLLVAPMPTASTSQILGFNECIEPYTSNFYVRITKVGRFKIINHHLVKDLQKLGLWRKDIIEQFVAADGSVQKIPEVPQDIKDLYKTVWEMSMKPIIDQAADRGPFIDQSQSLNLFVAMPDKLSTMHGKLTSMHFHAWKRGLKTGMYYLRVNPAACAAKIAAKFSVGLENAV